MLLPAFKHEFPEIPITCNENSRLGSCQRENIPVCHALPEVTRDRSHVVSETNKECVETAIGALVEKESHLKMPREPGSIGMVR
jgi:hypothetical protein